MELTPVQSEAVAAIGYADGVLYIKWISSGKTYAHPGVSEHTHAKLMQAGSKGQFIAQHIRKQHPGQAIR